MLITRCLPRLLESAGLRGEVGWLFARPAQNQRVLVSRLLQVRDAVLIESAEASARCEASRASQLEQLAMIASQLALYVEMHEQQPELVEPCLARALLRIVELGVGGIAGPGEGEARGVEVLCARDHIYGAASWVSAMATASPPTAATWAELR